MWHGTMFVDLDWPLNASSLLSASAELLVALIRSQTGFFGLRQGLKLWFQQKIKWPIVHRFLRYSTSKNVVTLKSRSKVTEGHWTDTCRSATYDFLLTFISNHGPVSHRFRDRWRFLSKIAKFSHPVYFAPLLTGFPLELGINAVVQIIEWRGYQKVLR